jgi:23S rRNA pseudouridine1911/1915/1917 synthase
MFNLSDLRVIYEDNHLIAVNKPSGMLVQGDDTGDTPISEFVKEYIKMRYNKPGDVFLGTVHRIDRPVSGVLLFARTSKALERMNKMFADQEIKKTYWAVSRTRPNPISGSAKHYLLKDSTKNITKAYDELSNRISGAKWSTLDYDLLVDLEGQFMLEVHPQTGRPHQIRCQLSRIGCPIIGDLKYGAKEGNKDSSIHLHCRSMEFFHPVKKEHVKITAEPNMDDRVWKRMMETVG